MATNEKEHFFEKTCEEKGWKPEKHHSDLEMLWRMAEPQNLKTDADLLREAFGGREGAHNELACRMTHRFGDNVFAAQRYLGQLCEDEGIT